MGKLSEQIEATCCGSLMDIGAKELLVKEVAEIEHLYKVRAREVVELEDEIVELLEKQRYGV